MGERGANSITETTIDKFLGGKLVIEQPAQGVRAGSDTVLLAAAVSPDAGDRVLEVGIGTGVASLCLAHRTPGLAVTGLEIQPDLLALAKANAKRNGVADRMAFFQGDLRAPPPTIGRGRYDHVFANPPFFRDRDVNLPANESRARARTEIGASLAAWIDYCLSATRTGGRITVIHRNERLDEITAELARGSGDIRVLPLLPHRDRPAKRVLVTASKGAAVNLTRLPGLVLHKKDGGYRPEIDAILRDGRPLVWPDP